MNWQGLMFRTRLEISSWWTYWKYVASVQDIFGLLYCVSNHYHMCVCCRSGRLLAAIRVCVWARRCLRGEAAEDQPRRAGGAGSFSHRTPGAHSGGRRLALCSGELVRLLHGFQRSPGLSSAIFTAAALVNALKLGLNAQWLHLIAMIDWFRNAPLKPLQ